MKCCRKQIGFTVIELMVVVAIAALLAAVVAPSFSTFSSGMKQKSLIGLLRGDLNTARSESITRNSRVLVCVKNTAGDGCDTNSSAGARWANGWVVCFDRNSDNICDASSALEPNPIIVRSNIDSVLNLSVLDSSSGVVSTVRFNPNGTQGTTSSDVTFSVSGSWSGVTIKTVFVSRTGSIVGGT